VSGELLIFDTNQQFTTHNLARTKTDANDALRIARFAA
jgi:hypothetical protein